MSTIIELRDARLEKLAKLKELGYNCYTSRVKRTHNVSSLINDFEDLSSSSSLVTIAGRITSLRSHGNLTFIDVTDNTGKFQLYMHNDNTLISKPENEELDYESIKYLDLGDFIEATGHLSLTKRGEKSLAPSTLRILTKTLRPLPDAHDGLKDNETRFRKRYLDIAVNQEIKERFIRKAKFWQAHRDFLNSKGFVEFNMPVLEHTTGGAEANPFTTHMDALDEDFYLRISQEFPLKKMLGAGYEKVYEIGVRFRNEGVSDEHLPEHNAIEYYMGYSDWQDGIKLTIDLFKYVAEETWGTTKFKIRGFDIDLSKDWEVLDYTKLIKDNFNIDVFNVTAEELKSVLINNKIKLPEQFSINRGLDYLWKSLRKTIAGPAILVGEPISISPLAKPDSQNREISQRFHPIIAGSELGNGYSELNDPIDQLERFLEQQELRNSGDKEAMMIDIDFVEMLEYGIPPSVGYGHSERFFWFFEGVIAKEGVVFPHLRREVDENNRVIYSQVDFDHNK